MSKRRQLNIRLTQEAQELLEQLAGNYDLTRTQAVVQGLQALARELNVGLDQRLDASQEWVENVNETQESPTPDAPSYWPEHWGELRYKLAFSCNASELPNGLREYCEANDVQCLTFQSEKPGSTKRKYYIDWDS